MKNNLLKIAFALSLIGIFVLLTITNLTKPNVSEIESIDKEDLNQVVAIKGEVISKINYNDSNFQITKIRDKTGEISVTSGIINLSKNQKVLVIGKVQEYDSELQISADKVSIFS